MDSISKKLDDLWRKGQLRDLEKDLDCFIRDHLGEIRRELQENKLAGTGVARRRYTRGELDDRQLVDVCVRSVLSKWGSCNPRRDIVEQRQEIDREVWYEGERRRAPVPEDLKEQIARAWASRHAPHWREWRLYQLLFIWEKKADEYIGLIAEKRA